MIPASSIARRQGGWIQAAVLSALLLAASSAGAAARVLSPNTGLLSPQFTLLASDDAVHAKQDERLEDARRDLERAAREIARLSTQAMDGPMSELIARLSKSEKRPMLGINIADIEAYPAGEEGSEARGVRVVGVSPNGPADRAGIKTGDVIVALNGQLLDDGSGRIPEAVVLELMSKLEPGDPVAVRFLREGKVNEVTAVAARFEDLHMGGLDGLLESLRDGSLMQSLRLVPEFCFQDLELATVSPELGAYFGTTEGLLVVHAPADNGLQLKDGDVILRIDGEVPGSSADALRLLRGAAGGTVSINVLRHGEKMLLDASVPTSPGESRWSWRFEDG